MLLLSAKARSAALGLALTAASPAAAAPSLRGSRRALQSGDVGGSGDVFEEDVVEDSGGDWVSHGWRPESGCAIHEMYGSGACDDPDDCDGRRSFACKDLETSRKFVVDTDLVGVFTGDGTFAFEGDAGAHLIDGYGEVIFSGEANINYEAMRVDFLSGTFRRAAPVVLEVVPDAASYYDVGGDEAEHASETSEDAPPIGDDVDSEDAAESPSEEAVEVAGTAAVSQYHAGAGVISPTKEQYESDESVTLNFDLSSGSGGDYKVGLFMRMANPQDGALPPLASLPLPPGATSGSVTFSRDTMGMMGWPLDLYEYGTGYDAYILDGRGADVVGPAQFNIAMDE